MFGLLVALAAPPLSAEPSPGAYLAARAALAAHDFPAARPLLAEALAADPAHPVLLEGSVVAALAEGDLDAAVEAARRLGEGGTRSHAAHLARLTRLARDGEWRRVLAALEAGRGVGALSGGLVRGWAWLGLGDEEAALSAFDELAAQDGLAAFGLTHKALALAALGDWAGAEAILTLPPGEGMQPSRRGLVALAQIMAEQGRPADGAAILSEGGGRGLDPALLDLRDRLAAGEAVSFDVARNPAEGFAEALYTVGAALGQGDPLSALLYARAALAIRPDHADAALLAARSLEALGQPALARAAFALVPPDDPAFLSAEIGRAESLRREGSGEAAAEILLALSRSHPGRADVQATLGDTLRTLGRHAEAEAAYDRALALYDAASPVRWFVLYTRAIARQAQDDWEGAEADLRAALALEPDQPQLLNHLGYSLVERGEKLDEALAMIERAVEAEPQNGAIVDSLGWAFFKLGRFEEAVEQLERAAALEPTDPVINDHLGDAYWKVGREREARFQWRRALSFGPEPEEAARIRLKLEGGLKAVGAGEAPAEEGREPAPVVGEGPNG
ncbi:tetratricopeptide repeat protein [Rubellimicrobium sp. CFH 75288]|nr:tetratricopeptide repeat protein [Rubellimicrobium sp. CFH 75288]